MSTFADPDAPRRGRKPRPCPVIFGSRWGPPATRNQANEGPPFIPWQHYSETFCVLGSGHPGKCLAADGRTVEVPRKQRVMP